MKTKILIVGVLAAVAVLVAVKWFVVSPTPQTETQAPVTGRTAPAAPAVALPPAPAVVAATPSSPAAPAEAAMPASLAEVAGAGAAPAVASAIAKPVAEETEVEPEPAIADFGTGRAHDRGLVANQAGDFPRVFIQTNDIVPVSVMFPGGAGAGAVTVRVMDGGSLDGSEVSRVLPVDGNGRVNFAFHAGEGRGSYRVTLRRGDWRQQLQFWAGPPHEVARTPLPEGAHLAEKL